MDILSMVLTVVGLVVFETISSVDNAIINAQVLSTTGPKARRWFLLWGILIAVFLVRGLLPWLIVWMAMPQLGPIGALTATFSSDPRVSAAIDTQAPILLMGGGVFLVFLFLNWLFLEEKHYGIPFVERFCTRRGVWFYAVVSIVLSVVIWKALHSVNHLLAFGAAVGASAYFITHGFRQTAEEKERAMVEGDTRMSDMSKVMYLQVIDATFSIDGVLGAFAFTLSVPLILVGNGIGAIVVRQLTVSNIDRIARYRFLQNGAMYSIVVLGGVMVLESFGAHIPTWFSPAATVSIVSAFFWMSVRAARRDDAAAA